MKKGNFIVIVQSKLYCNQPLGGNYSYFGSAFKSVLYHPSFQGSRLRSIDMRMTCTLKSSGATVRIRIRIRRIFLFHCHFNLEVTCYSFLFHFMGYLLIMDTLFGCRDNSLNDKQQNSPDICLKSSVLHI